MSREAMVGTDFAPLDPDPEEPEGSSSTNQRTEMPGIDSCSSDDEFYECDDNNQESSQKGASSAKKSRKSSKDSETGSKDSQSSKDNIVEGTSGGANKKDQPDGEKSGPTSLSSQVSRSSESSQLSRSSDTEVNITAHFVSHYSLGIFAFLS